MSKLNSLDGDNKAYTEKMKELGFKTVGRFFVDDEYGAFVCNIPTSIKSVIDFKTQNTHKVDGAINVYDRILFQLDLGYDYVVGPGVKVDICGNEFEGECNGLYLKNYGNYDMLDYSFRNAWKSYRMGIEVKNMIDACVAMSSELNSMPEMNYNSTLRFTRQIELFINAMIFRIEKLDLLYSNFVISSIEGNTNINTILKRRIIDGYRSNREKENIGNVPTKK